MVAKEEKAKDEDLKINTTENKLKFLPNEKKKEIEAPFSATIPKKKEYSLSPSPKEEKKTNSKTTNAMKISKILIQSHVQICFYH